MDPAEINKEWQDIISGKIPSSYMKDTTDWTPIYNWIAKRTSPGDMVLDVGCGLGHLASTLTWSGCEVTGVDISPAAIEQAVIRAPKAMFICADIFVSRYLLAMPSHTTICFTEVLEHIENDCELLQYIIPGTTVFISLPLGLEHLESAGHVRAFSTVKEIQDRYSELLRIDEWEYVPPHFFVGKFRRKM